MIEPSNEQIRYAGSKILLYRARPAAREFHRSPAKNRWQFGGNRSGKSESNIGFDLCSFALGLHPYRVTPRGAVIWAAANTWELVGKLLWSEKIKSYLPLTQIAAIVWHNKAAGIPAELRLRNGTTIEFRAYEQGRKAFEGRAIDAFYGDEQCGSDSEGIWQEVQARLLDKQGFSAQSMTPILFQGWLEDRIKALPATDSVHYADLNDNRRSRGGYVADSEIDAMIAEWPADVQETRIRGHFAAFLGSVYKAFRRDVHVCDVELPPDAEHYRAIDFGFNNPFVCLWLARYGPDRRWHIYAEHYQAREGLAWHAQRINARLGTFVATWADHDAQDVYELAQHGILTLPAKKDVRLGIELVQSRLQCDGSGRPGLTIAPCCENTIREMQAYRWSEGSGRTDPRDEPHKQHDHCPDSLRYCLYSVEGDSYFRR